MIVTLELPDNYAKMLPKNIKMVTKSNSFAKRCRLETLNLHFCLKRLDVKNYFGTIFFLQTVLQLQYPKGKKMAKAVLS